MISITDLTDSEFADLRPDHGVFIPAKIVQVRAGEASVVVFTLTPNGTRQDWFRRQFSMPADEIFSMPADEIYRPAKQHQS
jgi:hypothetical protein